MIDYNISAGENRLNNCQCKLIQLSAKKFKLIQRYYFLPIFVLISSS